MPWVKAEDLGVPERCTGGSARLCWELSLQRNPVAALWVLWAWLVCMLLFIL